MSANLCPFYLTCPRCIFKWLRALRSPDLLSQTHHLWKSKVTFWNGKCSWLTHSLTDVQRASYQCPTRLNVCASHLTTRRRIVAQRQKNRWRSRYLRIWAGVYPTINKDSVRLNLALAHRDTFLPPRYCCGKLSLQTFPQSRGNKFGCLGGARTYRRRWLGISRRYWTVCSSRYFPSSL